MQICQFLQIQFAIYTNTICNCNKYDTGFMQTQFANYADKFYRINTICDWDPCNFGFIRMHFDIQTICMRNFDSDIFKGQGCGLDAVCLQLENDKNVKKAEDKAWRKQGCSGFGLFVLFSFCPPQIKGFVQIAIIFVQNENRFWKMQRRSRMWLGGSRVAVGLVCTERVGFSAI